MTQSVSLSIDAGRLCHVRVNVPSGTAIVSLRAEEPLPLCRLTCGEHTFSFDPAYYTVYHGVKDFVLEIASDPDRMRDVRVWQDEMAAPVQDRSIGLPAPFVWPGRTLMIGNSLLTGFGYYGMCASGPERDFCAHVTRVLHAARPDASIHKLRISDFEGCTDMAQARAWLDGPLLEALDAKPELVIIQCGDNVNTSEKLAVYHISCEKLLSFVRHALPDAQVALVGEWYATEEKQTLMAEACRRTGCAFVDIEGLRSERTMGKVGGRYLLADGTLGVIDSEGVASHPGDAGMEAIARKIMDVLGMQEA